MENPSIPPSEENQPQEEAQAPEGQQQPAEQPMEPEAKKSHTGAIIAAAVGLVVVVGGAAAYFGGGQLFQGALPVTTTPIIEIGESPSASEEVAIGPTIEIDNPNLQIPFSTTCAPSNNNVLVGKEMSWKATVIGAPANSNPLYTWTGDFGDLAAAGTTTIISQGPNYITQFDTIYNNTGTQTMNLKVYADGKEVTTSCSVNVVENIISINPEITESLSPSAEEDDDNFIQYLPYLPETLIPQDYIPEAQIPDQPPLELILPPPGSLSCSLSSDTLVLDGNNVVTANCFVSQEAKSHVGVAFIGKVENKQEATVANLAKHLGVSNNPITGNITYPWDGADTNGDDVPPSNYTLVVAALYEGYEPDLVFLPLEIVQSAPAQPVPTPTPTPTPTPSTPSTPSTSTETTTTESTSTTSDNGQCAGFPDIEANDPDCDAIEYVKNIGAMTGTGSGAFDANSRLQRDQIAKVVLETFDLFNISADYCGGKRAFPDTGPSAWSFEYMCRAKDLGLVTGYQAGPDAGYYLPANLVNRAEFLAIILRNLDETMPTSGPNYGDVSDEAWFADFARYSYGNALFSGNNLQPENAVTRREAARVIYRLNTLGKI